MHSIIITENLDEKITKFTEQDIFKNVKDILELLRTNTQTNYRYEHHSENRSLICKTMPKLVETAKGEIKKRLKSREMDSRASVQSVSDDIEDKQLFDKQAEERAWNNILRTYTSDAKQTYKELLKDILQNESEAVKKSIAKNFDIAYKTLRLHASNLAHQQNDNLEEVKEGASQTSAPQENSLEYLLKGSPDKNSMQTILGSQAEKQGAALMISSSLIKRRAPEGNKLDQGKLNLDEKSIQTTFGKKGETPRVTLPQEEPNDKNQKDDKNKREQKRKLKDELQKDNKGM